ncbi:TPM domain-containing protein [Microbacterium testaceum]|uniref:TPM domain-containing protein n=1 Tax=Microbacterium testaceum TaxID=2033 RepID=A0A147F297_MICTE|nr:TPM domain-containing protein [Microbacterium testaceum]KTS04423.1 hypothetical protein RSA3_18010 [Microbacterium testaceum]
MRKPGAAKATVALLVLAAGVLGWPLSAAAVPPPALGSSYVLDQADVLTNAQEAEVQSRLLRLTNETGFDMWVAYVDEFTQPEAAADWANETANRNNLGPHQYLLAVSVGGRAYYLSGDVDDGALTSTQLADIEQDLVQPALSNGDWAGAAITAADGLTAAERAAPAPAPPTPAGSGPDVGLIVLLVVLVLAIGGGLLWFGLRRRRAASGGSSSREEDIDDLVKRAGSALVATDDAVKNSEQELGFARAQFGDEAAAPFVEVLTQAKADLDRAFTISQQLDDETPESPGQRRAGYTEILRLCASADEALDAKASAFEELRALEAEAPEALARVQEQHAAAAAALPGAEAELARLRQRYSDAALSPVADNPAQARARLDLAAQQIARASTALAAGDTGEAAVALRASQVAVSQADTLEKAVSALAADLATAEKRCADLAAEIDGDIAAAGALPDPDGRIAGAVAAATAQRNAARASLGGERSDPLGALGTLEKANATIDAVLAEARDAAERQRRAASQLESTLVQARAQVSSTESFIAARRGAVGPTARTRLAEAGSALVQAEQLRASDPVTALTLAQRAVQLSGEAGSLAQNDVGGFGGGSGGGTDMLGAILGGIAVNSLLGGGGSRSRGGFGGGFGGGSGGSVRSGGSRSRSGGGGMRSGGSRSSGGGRSRRGGGRF